MSDNIVFGILELIEERALHLLSISYIAWHYQRRSGNDAFHLLVVLSAAVFIASLLHGHAIGGTFLVIFGSSVFAYIMDRVWQVLSSRKGLNVSLALYISAASISLVAFDWLTNHAPVCIVFEVQAIRIAAQIAGVMGCILVVFSQSSRGALFLRLGVEHRWAFWSWIARRSPSSLVQGLVVLLFWIPSITVPITTSGVLSSSILRDAVLAILIARIVGARNPVLIMAIAVSAGVISVSIEFFVPGEYSSAVAELLVVLGLLFWLRVKSQRTQWEAMFDG